ncbi:hypothetical protein ACQ4T2_25655, partial [Escherichia coli]|uniref:hypothetical protein n=1 Tax=Escherichia coli TaxID=562 RepID=UPI003D31023A
MSQAKDYQPINAGNRFAESVTANALRILQLGTAPAQISSEAPSRVCQATLANVLIRLSQAWR